MSHLAAPRLHPSTQANSPDARAPDEFFIRLKVRLINQAESWLAP